MRFDFSQESGITISDTMYCEAGGDPAVYEGAPSCQKQENSVIVSNLKSGQYSYTVLVYGMINAGSAHQADDIKCSGCSDSTCSSLMESKTTRITFSEDKLDKSAIKIESSSIINGAKNQTLSVSLTLGNPLMANGTFSLKMPKRNYWFWYLGAATRDCLLEECDDQKLEVTARYANSTSSRVEIDIPQRETPQFVYEPNGDDMHD